MIELGSFWAYYSMWFAKTHPGGRNLMIEPDASNLQVGQRNFALNGLVGEFMQGSIGRSNDASKPFLWESDGAIHMVPQYCVDELIRQSKTGNRARSLGYSAAFMRTDSSPKSRARAAGGSPWPVAGPCPPRSSSGRSPTRHSSPLPLDDFTTSSRKTKNLRRKDLRSPQHSD